MEIRKVAAGDREAWARLYRGYAEFYGREIDEGMLGTVWGWLHDEAHVVEGLVAVTEDGVVGIAHYRGMPSPLRAGDVCFLDDLFVDPPSRGRGVAAALVARVGEIARENGWPMVRWITKEDNRTARRLYDRIACCTDWKVYEMPAG